MELVERWWNGAWGRLARRDVWLERETQWRVRIRQGDSDGAERSWWYDDEASARRMLDRALAAPTAGEWRELTKAYGLIRTGEETPHLAATKDEPD